METKESREKPVLHVLKNESVGQRLAIRKTVSQSALEDSRLLHQGAHKSTVNACNIVRQKVLRKLRKASSNCVAVVSPVSRDGKSVTATNLALSIARQPNHRAVLVELDLHKPCVAEMLGLTIEKGSDDFLSDPTVTIEQCLIDPGIDNVRLMPVRRARLSAAELIADDRLPELLTQLCQSDPEQTIVLDLPPLFATPDALAVLELCGCSLLVVRDSHTPADMLKRAMEVMQPYTLAGVVLNACRDKVTSYYDY